MVSKKLYLETSVISYLAARTSSNPVVAGRQTLTREWWRHRRKRFLLLISELVINEAKAGNTLAAQQRMELLKNLTSLEISEAAVVLSEQLVDKGVIPAKFSEDALHIAICAVHGVDFLLTWNCKHLANAMLRPELESIIEAAGYQAPIICTPAELLEDKNV